MNFSPIRSNETWLASLLIAGAIMLAGYCALYAVQNFSIETDVRGLFPTNLPWAQRDKQFAKTFPQNEMLVVVDAPTPEFGDRASDALAAALRRADHIRAVEEPLGGAFFKQNGLLFLPTAQLARNAAGLKRAAPLIGGLAADPSLSGILRVFSGALGGGRNASALATLVRPMNAASDALQNILANRPAQFSWRGVADSSASGPQHRFIEITPELDFNALEPARAATDAIEHTAKKLDLAAGYQAQVRVTGLAPLNDAQFATLKDNAFLNAAVSAAAVLFILWLALRSWRIIVAAMITVICGLSYSAALGLFLVGSLNLISVAFFVLFVGLAVDFVIQFSVRYRAERHDTRDLKSALLQAWRKAIWPLALAGGATALGFSSFLPTSYRGLSELGKIAGPGMLIAFCTSITLLPALLWILRPHDEPEEMRFSALAPVDNFLQRRRTLVLVGTLALVLLGTPLLAFLRFDFNTLHMQDQKSPPVATFLALRKNPATGANAAEVVAPDFAAAQADAKRLGSLPEVAQTRTLAGLVSSEQSQKLELIHALRSTLEPYLGQRARKPPNDREDVAAIRSTAELLSSMAARGIRGSEAAARLARLLSSLADADPSFRDRAAEVFVDPLTISLDDVRESLRARPISLETVPADLKRQWLAPDGHARVQILPKGDPDDTTAIRNFARAVLEHEPTAAGPAITLFQAGNTVVRAFIEAGLFALVAIALLLWIALRRITDVLMTLVPLLLAAVLTLELCVLLGIQLNFTNIIAFPLLLGVGVAFKIYYIMAWRRGRTALVQSTLTRAVVFSALTTATAFGSLWLSHHPGTSSMGELMMISLLCTMMAAVLFQPALMGPTRDGQPDVEAAVLEGDAAPESSRAR